jgi:hypothetical protein
MNLRQCAILRLAGVVASLVMAQSTFAQGYGHGTSEIVFFSPDKIIVAADSKEVYSEMRHGKRVTAQSNICKAIRIGPYYALIAGVARGSNGFDVLREAQRIYMQGDTLDDIVESLAGTMPIGLVSVLDPLRRSDDRTFRAYTNGPATTIALLGFERGRPRVIISDFYVDSGMQVRRVVRQCGSMCADGSGAYALGIHDAIDKFVEEHGLPQHPTLDDAQRLLALEYSDRPDIVGGPQLLLEISSAGESIINRGACSADWGGRQ